MLVAVVCKKLAKTNVPVGVNGAIGVDGCLNVLITLAERKILFSTIKKFINLNVSDHVIVSSKMLLVL